MTWLSLFRNTSSLFASYFFLAQYGLTPLHLACQKNNVEAAVMLIIHGADSTILNAVRYLFGCVVIFHWPYLCFPSCIKHGLHSFLLLHSLPCVWCSCILCMLTVLMILLPFLMQDGMSALSFLKDPEQVNVVLQAIVSNAWIPCLRYVFAVAVVMYYGVNTETQEIWHC